MAAGEGTRMRSSLPKMLHPVCGRPMVAWPILAAREAGAGRVAAIVSPERDISVGLPEGVETVLQHDSDGTGGALRAALDLIREADTVIVLSGDHPVISADVIAGLLSCHRETGAAATVMTAVLDDPGTYGRIVRDDAGDLARVAETKAPGDATAEELSIREVNAGTYAFAAGPLADALEQIGNDNAQGEYYLGDVLPLMRDAGLRVAAHTAPDDTVMLGVNTRVELAQAEAEVRTRILNDHMLAGVTIVDPSSTWIDADVAIGPDARIEPGTTLRGATEVGTGSTVGPLTTLIDTKVGQQVTILHAYLADCEVLDDCTIGPFAYLRPGALLKRGAKAGTFVEIKNSEIGEGAKVPHLSYVGDAEVGAGSNLGAGTITANYDGFRKHRTVIGDHVHLGVDTMLIAPVEVGDAAYTGAGAVIKRDVPKGALAVSDNDQRNIEGYADERSSAERAAPDTGEEGS
jgi:bifunctional UDP-N-acetylglucosamine pyrophosphorylase/glucosamine-1-phosphate N-acetyltransferase